MCPLIAITLGPELSMDRNIVYPGAIPLDTDILTINQNTMIALGYLIRATLGTNIAADGLACTPTVPASMTVLVGPGSMTQMSAVDTVPFGSLSAGISNPLMKMGINAVTQSFNVLPPQTTGQSTNYLIQANLQEADTGLTVLPYYNAANPSQPFSGPTNSGLPQATSRNQYVQIQLKNGVPAAAGTQQTPIADQGWVGLYSITASYGQTTITSEHIRQIPGAPFIAWTLPNLRPGFGSGVKTITATGTFTVPAGVTRVEVELWGAGSGSFASTTGGPSGGGSGGGYARKRIDGLTPGQIINVSIGRGGNGGVVNGASAGSGGATSFGSFFSAAGGSLNFLAIAANPQFGATPPGVGIGGDVNLGGSAGQAAVLNQGGMGGGAPMGGSQNSGTSGVAGVFPGGGAAGAGTGANSATPYDGAAGADGLAVVRW